MSNTRPLLLDLFCCAGGASKGYYDAGFEVIGVDIAPQPRYPYEFVQADALDILRTLLYASGRVAGYRLSDFAAFAASPPCQGYSVTKSVNPNAGKYPLLIPEVRRLLKATVRPYAIENVEGAKAHMQDYVTLCGSQFGMRADFNGENAYLRRHRLFETNFLIPDPGLHDHSGYGIDWMNRHELDESIPPAYTEYLGAYMMRAVNASGTYGLKAA